MFRLGPGGGGGGEQGHRRARWPAACGNVAAISGGSGFWQPGNEEFGVGLESGLQETIGKVCRYIKGLFSQTWFLAYVQPEDQVWPRLHRDAAAGDAASPNIGLKKTTSAGVRFPGSHTSSNLIVQTRAARQRAQTSRIGECRHLTLGELDSLDLHSQAVVAQYTRLCGLEQDLRLHTQTSCTTLT